VTPVAAQLAETIRRLGPLPFDRFMDVALYAEPDGFYASGGGAGRAGRDFITSPEVGSLFGVLVARALDGFWSRLDEVDPYLVVEAGAGRGTLARDVLRAAPACARALRYVLVERSPALREVQSDRLQLELAREVLGPVVQGADPDEPPEVIAGSGPLVTALAALPAVPMTGVVFANELFDNLPFRIAESTATGWSEVRVTLAGDQFGEVLVPAEDGFAAGLPDAPPGLRLPVHVGMAEWLRACAATLRRGWLVVVDYAAPTAELVERPAHAWLRTYADHGPAGDVLREPGTKDITTDVNLDALARAAHDAGFVIERQLPQAQWLRELGVDDLAAAGRREWEARAGVGDVPALAARSRVSEAAALTDPAGLGAHTVVVLRRV
jgi:SAM-dependent MidA family methyltransferase